MFFINEDTDIASYSDGNTPCISDENVDGVITSLDNKTLEVLLRCFNGNLMQINADKYHLLLSTSNTLNINTGRNFGITNNQTKKLLCVTFDHKLSLHIHILELCKRNIRKTHALSRVESYFNILKRRFL